MRKAVWVAIVVAVGLACFTLTPIDERDHTCAYCRLRRTDLSVFGVLVRSPLRENEYSRWYSAHVERSHEHLWAPAAHSAMINLFGMTRSQPYLGFRAIRLISPDTQIRVYEKFANPRDAKELFEILGRKYDNSLEGEYQSTLASLKLGAIRQWEREGFPGTWDERWDRYSAENRELMSWLESLPRGFDDPEVKSRH